MVVHFVDIGVIGDLCLNFPFKIVNYPLSRKAFSVIGPHFHYTKGWPYKRGTNVL